MDKFNYLNLNNTPRMKQYIVLMRTPGKSEFYRFWTLGTDRKSIKQNANKYFAELGKTFQGCFVGEIGGLEYKDISK